MTDVVVDLNEPRGAPELALDGNGLEILDRRTCFQLLATATLGRLAISTGALPVILPINFRLIGERIVFRTGIGTKLEAATRHAIVAFEVDSFDAFSHTGWSVCVTGVAREVVDPVELARLRRAHIPRWAPSEPERIVAVSAEMISGRRLVPGRPCGAEVAR